MKAFITLLACLAATPRFSVAQERGAAALGELVQGIGMTPRVLVIGAHPDDEDTQLIAWLAKGRHVETAYLSLTRGDGGQNLIGNELGPALGIIRTEELLAARRVDGGRQYFARAYDFGFSKTADETFRHWPRDSILEDVVTVMRAFRPQVVIAIFSGTPRDGHGHHQVSGILARAAFDAAGDTVRFPRSTTSGLGAWTPAKFYRSARFGGGATLEFNVGEFSPLLGRSYAEIAAESRSQHLSQGQGNIQRKGYRADNLRLESSRLVNAAGAPLPVERSIFDGIDTAWARFDGLALPPRARTAIDSLAAVLSSVRAETDLAHPARMVAPLALYVHLLSGARDAVDCPDAPIPTCANELGDLAVTLESMREKASSALLDAASVSVEAAAPRELVAEGDTVPVKIEVFNQGSSRVELLGAEAWAGRSPVDGGSVSRATAQPSTVPPDSSATVQLPIIMGDVTGPWWLRRPLAGDVFDLTDSRNHTIRAPELILGEDRVQYSAAAVKLRVNGVVVIAPVSPIVYRYADPAKGDRRRPLAGVPAVSVLLDRDVEYARANTPIDRMMRVHVASALTVPRTVTVSLTLPTGLTADSTSRTILLAPFARTDLDFRVRGQLAVGRHTVQAQASAPQAGVPHVFQIGYVPIEYEHIRPQRFYRRAEVAIQSVSVKVPPRLNIAYVPGVGDNVAPMLQQLGVPVTTLDPAQVAHANLSRFTTVVTGPRAFGASEPLAASGDRLLQFARDGGTVVEQYGQYEMTRPGILPYPITLGRPADRVTEEDAPVTVLDPASPLLSTPNKITSADFADWVQERSSYMPHTFDQRYHALLSMHDTGEAPVESAILVARLGKGAFVYTTLAFFRQLPSGNPGAARLFVNLLAAGKP